MPQPITRGDLVDDLYRVVDALNGAVAAVNNCDTSLWNDKEASRRCWIAYDAMDRLTRHMAVRARLVPEGGATDELCSLDAIARSIQQRAEKSEFTEDSQEQRADERRKLRLEAAE